MRVLKLTILVEPGISKASLANVFGDYILLGRNCRFMEFTFPSVSMLSAKHLKPINDLINMYEAGKPLKFKMFYLHDAATNVYSPMSLHCFEGTWYIVAAATGIESNHSDSLYNLF